MSRSHLPPEAPVPSDHAPAPDPLASDSNPPGSPPPIWLRDTPFWALSALLHLVLFVLLLHLVASRASPSSSTKEATIHVAPPPRPPAFNPKARRDTRKREKILDLNLRDVTFVPRLPPKPTLQMPKGLPDRISDILDGRHFHDAGIGSGRAGSSGDWEGTGRLARIGAADEETEDAVRAALRWLVRHQSPDGSWKAADFVKQCARTCRNLHPDLGDGQGLAEHDAGVTALAMLAFTGYGHTHLDGEFPRFRAALRKAMRYLLDVQVHSSDPTTNGRFESEAGEQWVYDHAIATMALAELLLMSNDIIHLQLPVADAVKLCLRARNEGFGWRYGIRPGDNDTSVTGWMVLALKTARNARLRIPRKEYETALAGALHWVDRATAASGRTGYMAPGDEGSRLLGLYPDPYPFSKELSCMTGVGVLCRIFSGQPRKSRAVRSGIDLLSRHPPQWREKAGRAPSTINFYYWYYASYALFQYGGPQWKKWNKAMRNALLPSQRTGGDEDGSWDPIGEWGAAGGRVYATALGAMTLEVYYRYVRLERSVVAPVSLDGTP